MQTVERETYFSFECATRSISKTDAFAFRACASFATTLTFGASVAGGVARTGECNSSLSKPVLESDGAPISAGLFTVRGVPPGEVGATCSENHYNKKIRKF